MDDGAGSDEGDARVNVVHYLAKYDGATEAEARAKWDVSFAEILASHPGLEIEWRIPFSAYRSAKHDGWECYGRFVLKPPFDHFDAARSVLRDATDPAVVRLDIGPDGRTAQVGT